MLETAVVAAHVVRGPASAEFIASGGKLSYKVAQPAVEGVAAGLGAEDGNHIVGGEFPIREEPPGPFFIQEYEACVVGGPDWVDVHLGMQSKAEFVGGKDVHAGVADECRRVSNGVKGELHTWPDLLWCGSTLPLACSAVRARSNRCALSASSSWRALASASKTLSDTPARFPRSSRV